VVIEYYLLLRDMITWFQFVSAVPGGWWAARGHQRRCTARGPALLLANVHCRSLGRLGPTSSSSDVEHSRAWLSSFRSCASGIRINCHRKKLKTWLSVGLKNHIDEYKHCAEIARHPSSMMSRAVAAPTMLFE
jgi:hypothetical protein